MEDRERVDAWVASGSVDKMKLTVLSNHEMHPFLARELLMRGFEESSQESYMVYGVLAEVVQNALTEGRVIDSTGEMGLVVKGLKLLKKTGKEAKNG